VADLPVTLKENVTAVLSSKLEEETKVKTISTDAVVSDSTQVAQNVMILRMISLTSTRVSFCYK